jgi:RNA polymerase sigma factor (sigma-70 family)
LKEPISNRQPFIEYLDSYKKLIVKVARIYCENREDTKDLIQEIVIQLWKSYSKYDPTYSISTWTYRIALNVSISFLRKETARRKTYHSYNHHIELLQWEDDPVDDPIDQLYLFISKLKPIDKAIITLYFEGCKYKEIAEIMGMTPTNISTKMLRIKEELTERFKPLKN